jgi:hypothetical protein
MYKRSFILILFLLLFTAVAQGQEFKGAILFFPDQASRPPNDQFEVKAGHQVDVCVQIQFQNHPLLQSLLANPTGFRLILEDEKVPPNAIIIQEEPKKNFLKPDSRGCYFSRFKVPPLTEEGVYQVADLLFKFPGRGYLSIHQLLYDFSKADELKVINPSADTEKPILLEISTFQEQTRRIAKAFDFYKIKVKQDFTFEEKGSGLAPGTLKIYYRLMEDGERTGIYQTQCKKYFKQKNKFHCELELTRPRFQWEQSHLILELDSIYLEDKAGNQLVLSDPETFKKAAAETPIRFEFRQKNSGLPKNNSAGPLINREVFKGRFYVESIRS